MRDFEALTAFIAEREAMPFTWGRDENDCISYAAGAILSMTGKNKLAGIGKWTNERGALRMLAKYGGIEQAVSSILTEIPLAHAHRGDICLVELEHGPALMVIEGVTLVGPGLNGNQRMPRFAILKTWSASE